MANGAVTRPIGSLFRADVAGVARKLKPYRGAPTQLTQREIYRVDIVEVKGHKADWKREIKKGRLSRKWSCPVPDNNGLWLLVSSDITDNEVLPFLPEVWGLLRASEAVDDVVVVREPAHPASWRPCDDLSLVGELFSVGACQSLPLPNMGHSINEIMTGPWKTPESDTCSLEMRGKPF